LLPKIDLRQYRANTTVSWVVAGYWTLTLALVWWTPWVEIPWFLTAAVGTLGRIATQPSSTDQKEERVE
jgi:uncharacterized membrane protein